jgi:hypothetical protein
VLGGPGRNLQFVCQPRLAKPTSCVGCIHDAHCLCWTISPEQIHPAGALYRTIFHSLTYLSCSDQTVPDRVFLSRIWSSVVEVGISCCQARMAIKISAVFILLSFVVSALAFLPPRHVQGPPTARLSTRTYGLCVHRARFDVSPAFALGYYAPQST